MCACEREGKREREGERESERVGRERWREGGREGERERVREREREGEGEREGERERKGGGEKGQICQTVHMCITIIIQIQFRFQLNYLPSVYYYVVGQIFYHLVKTKQITDDPLKVM